jgi:hypothetical protein
MGACISPSLEHIELIQMLCEYLYSSLNWRLEGILSGRKVGWICRLV